MECGTIVNMRSCLYTNNNRFTWLSEVEDGRRSTILRYKYYCTNLPPRTIAVNSSIQKRKLIRFFIILNIINNIADSKAVS